MKNFGHYVKTSMALKLYYLRCGYRTPIHVPAEVAAEVNSIATRCHKMIAEWEPYEDDALGAVTKTLDADTAMFLVALVASTVVSDDDDRELQIVGDIIRVYEDIWSMLVISSMVHGYSIARQEQDDRLPQLDSTEVH